MSQKLLAARAGAATKHASRQFGVSDGADGGAASAPTGPSTLPVGSTEWLLPGWDGGALAVMPAALGATTAAMSFVLDNGDQTPAQAMATSATRPVGHADHLSDKALRADVARTNFGTTGKNITIGILSDSFDLSGSMWNDARDGDLTHWLKILKEGQPGGHDEGRAMAELIHMVAPDARIEFYSATGSEAQFAAGITALTNAGADIIVDDVAYLDEPFFQDGSPLQTAVENAVGRGVSYFTSASNEGTDFYQHAFAPTRTVLHNLPGVWTVNNFGGPGASRPYVNLTIATNATTSIDLQWDQAYASIGHGHGATSSLAMALYTASGQLVATAGTVALGHDPRQLLQYANTTGQTNFRLVIMSNAPTAPLPGQFKFIVYGGGTIQDANAGIGSGTVTGHELVAGVNTVGAVAATNTPRFGGTNTVENYSSVGSGQILFNAQGQRLATPSDTQKVSFLAPDGSMTSVFAPFYGTSAAAPNAAAVAALMLQEDPYLLPADISGMLAQSAVAAHGPSGSTGAGLIQADAAVALAHAAMLAHHV